ncbi:uncharacterized protein RCC_02460 [Ramularia collo-cygni]|uniref:Uncharacterized protein n=1 Tax=Ramularia collo-cygni TaxID=112498 RepID=A0A2D3UZF8_9PEZI|nr:uncharacterized protein RCC_02460 [Ramularia collo-cygni]CZT16626.1 uncharacterized protein RCC_02460 [Ramularia collo-cygni]
MKLLPLLSLATAAAATKTKTTTPTTSSTPTPPPKSWSNFEITSLKTHQPNGDPSLPSDCANFSDQQGCYIISFDLLRPTDNPLLPDPQTAFCVATWADNNPANCHLTYEGCDVPFAVNSPTCWTRCWQDRRQEFDRLSGFLFRLGKGFQVGEFVVEVQGVSYDQFASATFLYSASYTISNSSAEELVCEIDGSGGAGSYSGIPGLHAGGDCAMPEGSKGISLAVESTTDQYLGGYCTR